MSSCQNSNPVLTTALSSSNDLRQTKSTIRAGSSKDDFSAYLVSVLNNPEDGSEAARIHLGYRRHRDHRRVSEPAPFFSKTARNLVEGSLPFDKIEAGRRRSGASSGTFGSDVSMSGRPNDITSTTHEGVSTWGGNALVSLINQAETTKVHLKLRPRRHSDHYRVSEPAPFFSETAKNLVEGSLPSDKIEAGRRRSAHSPASTPSGTGTLENHAVASERNDDVTSIAARECVATSNDNVQDAVETSTAVAAADEGRPVESTTTDACAESKLAEGLQLNSVELKASLDSEQIECKMDELDLDVNEDANSATFDFFEQDVTPSPRYLHGHSPEADINTASTTPTCDDKKDDPGHGVEARQITRSVEQGTNTDNVFTEVENEYLSQGQAPTCVLNNIDVYTTEQISKPGTEGDGLTSDGEEVVRSDSLDMLATGGGRREDEDEQIANIDPNLERKELSRSTPISSLSDRESTHSDVKRENIDRSPIPLEQKIEKGPNTDELMQSIQGSEEPPGKTLNASNMPCTDESTVEQLENEEKDQNVSIGTTECTRPELELVDEKYINVEDRRPDLNAIRSPSPASTVEPAETESSGGSYTDDDFENDDCSSVKSGRELEDFPGILQRETAEADVERIQKSPYLQHQPTKEIQLAQEVVGVSTESHDSAEHGHEQNEHIVIETPTAGSIDSRKQKTDYSGEKTIQGSCSDPVVAKKEDPTRPRPQLRRSSRFKMERAETTFVIKQEDAFQKSGTLPPLMKRHESEPSFAGQSPSKLFPVTLSKESKTTRTKLDKGSVTFPKVAATHSGPSPFLLQPICASLSKGFEEPDMSGIHPPKQSKSSKFVRTTLNQQICVSSDRVLQDTVNKAKVKVPSQLRARAHWENGELFVTLHGSSRILPPLETDGEGAKTPPVKINVTFIREEENVVSPRSSLLAVQKRRLRKQQGQKAQKYVPPDPNIIETRAAGPMFNTKLTVQKSPRASFGTLAASTKKMAFASHAPHSGGETPTWLKK